MGTTADPDKARESLDALMTRLTEPVFVSRHRRVPAGSERGGHVSPTILAVSSPRSRYVRRWRRHARRCPECATVFRYLGLPVD